MKKILFILSVIFITFSCKAQFSLQPLPLCWSTNGVDSSIYKVVIFAPGRIDSRQVGYFNYQGEPITVSGGTLTAGLCNGDTLLTTSVLPADCQVGRTLDHDDLTSGTTTYTADSFWSLGLTVVSGSADITINGKTRTYPMGFTTNVSSPHFCNYFEDSVTVAISSGRVLVTLIK